MKALSIEQLTLIDKSLKLIYDAHVQDLLNISSPLLSEIAPNKYTSVFHVLSKYNHSVIEFINSYEQSVCITVEECLDKMQAVTLVQPDIENIMKIVHKYTQEQLYQKRFELTIKSIQMHLSGYGMPTDLNNHRIDLPRASCQAFSRNLMRRMKHRVELLLELRANPYQSTEEVLRLNPTFMGIGFNLKAIYKKLKK